MDLYEQRMKDAQDNDKVIFYDYLSYKRAAGWWTGLINDDWNRPYKIERAKYYAAFLQNLPNYYFLCFPVKELLKSCYSGGYCHACAVALSLYFDNFEIITCNLINYANHYNQKSNSKIDKFEHTFIVINFKNKRTVIDTTWGMITDYNTYKYIFNIDKIKIIHSSELKNIEIYQYIKKRIYDIGPSYESELHEDEVYEKYSLMLHEYMDICKNYSNSNNSHLQDFITRCLYQTSNSACLDDWRMSLHFKPIIDFQIQYPTNDLFSFADDEFDFTLDSPHKDTKEKNAKILENYHKEIPPSKVNTKQKILELVKRYKNLF